MTNFAHPGISAARTRRSAVGVGVLAISVMIGASMLGSQGDREHGSTVAAPATVTTTAATTLPIVFASPTHLARPCPKRMTMPC